MILDSITFGVGGMINGPELERSGRRHLFQTLRDTLKQFSSGEPSQNRIHILLHMVIDGSLTSKPVKQGTLRRNLYAEKDGSFVAVVSIGIPLSWVTEVDDEKFAVKFCSAIHDSILALDHFLKKKEMTLKDIFLPELGRSISAELLRRLRRTGPQNPSQQSAADEFIRKWWVQQWDRFYESNPEPTDQLRRSFEKGLLEELEKSTKNMLQ